MKVYNYQTQQPNANNSGERGSSKKPAGNRQKFSIKNWRGWLHDLPWTKIGT